MARVKNDLLVKQATGAMRKTLSKGHVGIILSPMGFPINLL
jgi:adenosine/AMP kinase